MTNFERTSRWLAACGKTPGNEENLSVQIGCHIEEFAEFMSTIRPTAIHEEPSLIEAFHYTVLALEGLARAAKKGNAKLEILHREAALDALCDSEVTGNGVAYLAGFKKEQADARVLDANNAKLVDGKPVILPGGKIGKPEGWVPAFLSDCV